MATLTPKESEEQATLFKWAKMREPFYPALQWMFHIPNGGSRNTIEAANLKRQGIKAGVSDIFLPAAVGKYHGLFIEMKRKGGKASEMQTKFIEDMKAQGYYATVCVGWQAAENVIIKYLEGQL